jgi:hypothetical protein
MGELLRIGLIGSIVLEDVSGCLLITDSIGLVRIKAFYRVQILGWEALRVDEKREVQRWSMLLCSLRSMKSGWLDWVLFGD